MNRVLGGVCGGLGETWRVNPWWIRAVFAVLTIASLGVGAALYLALWWALPQESLVAPARSSVASFLSFIALTVILIGAWVGQITGALFTEDGQSLLLPVVLITLSAVLLLRQLRG